MKRNIFFWICIGCLCVLSQCDYIGISDDGYNFDINESWDYSTIAFLARITDNSGEWSLCTVDKSGKDMRKIVDKTLACQKPVRSHLGTKLLFTAVKFDSWVNDDNFVEMSAEYELCIVNTDGTDLTVIERIDRTENGNFGNVAWSPDDSQIIYVRTYDNYWNNTCLILCTMSDNTHTILQTEGNVCSAVFSPDGKQIVYCTSVENVHHIYKMDADGNNNQLIIENGGSPRWSPQGDKIVYSSTGQDRSSQISVANADGSNQKQLTSSVSPGWWDSGFGREGNSDPQWTVDGKKIVYVSHDNEKAEIFIMNVDGSEKTRLTKAAYRDDSPEITPGGKYILFESVRDDMIGGVNPGICIMTIDGKNQQTLSKTGSYPVACK